MVIFRYLLRVAQMLTFTMSCGNFLFTSKMGFIVNCLLRLDVIKFENQNLQIVKNCSIMILSESQLYELTKKKHCAAQVSVLKSIGIDHKVRPDGSVVVSKVHVEQVLGVVVNNTISKQIEPDWASINA